MKLVLGIFLALLANHVQAADKPFKINDGMYYQKLDSDSGELFYQVDTIAQQCFVMWYYHVPGGITTIPCVDLAKRPEWKPILTWVK